MVDRQPYGTRQTVRRLSLTFAFTYPGEGATLLRTRYFERDYVTGWTFSAGPHQALEGDFDDLCSALA
jgi:hypothetical protein